MALSVTASVVLGSHADDIDLDSIATLAVPGLLCAASWWPWRAR